MGKKIYPGGFRLTLKKARELAMQEFGTCKGLGPDEWARGDGYYLMKLGNLEVRINPDPSGSGCIEVIASVFNGNGKLWQLHDRETLKRHEKEEKVYRLRERREAFEEWVSWEGAERCHQKIDEFWGRTSG